MPGGFHVLSAQYLSILAVIYVLGLMATSDKYQLLSAGDLLVTGRLVDASNATLFATVTLGSDQQACIYKPIAGERPLWDFPDGTLADREYAAFLVSDFLELDLVPLTLLREGPYGKGMVQEWINIDESIDLANFLFISWVTIGTITMRSNKCKIACSLPSGRNFAMLYCLLHVGHGAASAFTNLLLSQFSMAVRSK